jgi:hypothetical protein
MFATIYKATNILNGRPYIGFDSSWPNRQKEHLRQAFQPKSSSYSTAFHKAIRESKPESFVWEVLYTSDDLEHTLNVMESRFIQEHNSHHLYGHGYNMTLGGNGSVIHSLIEIEKMCEAQKRRYTDPEQRRLTGEAIKKSYTPELIKKRSQGTKKSYTPELREIRRQQMLCKNPAKTMSRIECPHCHLVGSSNNMKRYHFDNCEVSRG